jgi:hypothetical protein
MNETTWKNAGISLSIFSIILALFDFALPMVGSTTSGKVASVAVSIVTIAFNALFIKNEKKEATRA